METVAGPLGELRGGTSTGVSLSTTAAYIQFPAGTRHLFLTPRNFSTAVVARIAFLPYLAVLKVSGGTVTDYSAEAQDGSTGTSAVLSSLATTDFVYIGAAVPFAGVTIDIDSANDNASVLSVDYWDGNSWEDITPTDGTDVAGDTLKQDGAVTWTIPADWEPTSLRLAGAPKGPFTGNKFYWTRWSVSAALDSSTTADHMLAIPRSTAYFELQAGQALETRVTVGPEGISGLVGLTDAGTSNLVVGYGSAYASGFA